MSRQLLITLSVLALLFLAGIPTVSADYYTVAPVIRQGVTIFIGEQGLNITGALNLDNTYHTPNYTTLGWLASAAPVASTPPQKILDLTGYNSAVFTATPQVFVGCTGYWYPVNSSTGFGITTPVFTVADPNLDVNIWNFLTETDESGRIVVRGDPVGFRVNTNMYSALDPARRGPVYNNESDGYIDIKAKDQRGATMTGLYNNETGIHTLLILNVTGQPWAWGSPANPSSSYNWSTDARDPRTGDYIYPPGTYSALAESGLNNMKSNYNYGGADYTGKIVSQTETITLTGDTIQIEATKDTVIAGKSFSVTIAGKPLANCMLWIRGTGSMSGESGDQPPLLNPNQRPVYYDDEVAAGTGIHPIGDHLFEHGNGSTVFSDVASAPFNCTRYYATARLSTSGIRTVEFVTRSLETRAQKYTIHVENEFPANSSNYKSDEVDINVENSTVTIVAAGDYRFYLGEEIKLSGTNTRIYKTYLFLTGPNMKDAGSQIQNRDPGNYTVVNNDASTFKVIDVNGDNTWSLKWGTLDYTLDAGTYTIYAVSHPYDKCHLANAAYGTISVLIKIPFKSATAAQSTVGMGNKINNTGTYEGDPSEVQVRKTC
ncbi:MAG: DUF3821 domain-containing protein [Methanoregula sp.]